MKSNDRRTEHMLALLDEIVACQQEVDRCRHDYQSLERDLEAKSTHNLSPDEKEAIMREIATLNREFEAKINLLYEDLNERLIRGHDLACALGHGIGHDFKIFWDYMTGATKEEVKTERVLSDIAHIKKNLHL